ncbi:MAG TPA: four helix bundle protein [Burkholderiales bacterium]|nr:four helix bundle protein [Burkholderiales bacterium]
MSVTDFRDLNVWQLAMDLAESVYQLTLQYPKSEVYGLSSQLQRAAVSIPSNIAEGHARDSTKEFLRFLSVAQGSLAELETQLILSGRLSYLDQKQLTPLLEKSREVGRMLHGLQRALRAKDIG